MATQITVEQFVDLERYGKLFPDLLGQSTSAGIQNTIKKRNKPRLTGDLMSNIRFERIDFSNYRILSDLPYSAAQEFGRPDLAKYTFTPYMRPGALNGTTRNKMVEYVSSANEGALNRSKL